MKNKIIVCLAALFVAACTVITGCNEKKESFDRTGDRPSKITSQPDESHFIISITPAKKPEHPPITFEEGEKTLEIEQFSIQAIERVNNQVSKDINKAIDDFEEFILHEVYTPDCFALRENLDSGNQDASGFPYNTYIKYASTRNDGRAISIIATVEDYSAGVLMTSVAYGFNYDPTTGEFIKQPFCDITNKEDFDSADNYMFEKLNEKYDGVVSYEGLGFPSFVDAASDYWQFTDSGVKVIFPAGLIAPMEAGTLEIEYTKEELPEFAQKYFN